MPFQWTAEHIYSLMLNAKNRRIIRQMSGPEKWSAIGRTSHLVWGELPVKNKPSIQTAVHLAEPTFSCSCRSQHLRCDHAVSLLLMWIEVPEAFSISETPAWTQSPVQDTPSSDQNHPRSDGHVQSMPTKLDSEARQSALMHGLEDLELWLRDLVRNGLADPQARLTTSWKQVSQRLIDAGASEIAREVRRIGGVAASQEGWSERLLGDLGLLFLLIQGFKHLDSLPPESQADLRAAAGWLPRLDPLRSQISSDDLNLCVLDHWHVVSNQLVQEGRQSIQRTWLWGAIHNRAALIVQRSYQKAVYDARLITGTLLHAEVSYFPTSVPIRAELGRFYQRVDADTPSIGYLSVEEAVTAYSRAVSRNPWVGPFPFLLSGITAAPAGTGWMLYDQSGALPLPSNDEHLWHLLAMTRHSDTMLFGEWNGDCLQPLSVRTNGRWVELRTLQGTR